MVDSVVPLSSNGAIKVVSCLLCHRHFALDALQVILELLDRIILCHYFNSMLESLAFLLQLVTSDRFLD